MNKTLATILASCALAFSVDALANDNSIQARQTEKKVEKVERRLINYEMLVNMHGKRLVDDIIRHEGLRTKAYTDTRGYRTIAVGFNLDRAGAKEKIEALGLDYDAVRTERQEITREQAFYLMKDDMHDAVYATRRYLGDALPTIDQDAQEIIVNMAYNLGETKLGKFVELRKALLNRNYKQASIQMENSKWYGQVGNRSKELVSRMRNALNN